MSCEDPKTLKEVFSGFESEFFVGVYIYNLILYVDEYAMQLLALLRALGYIVSSGF